MRPSKSARTRLPNKNQQKRDIIQNLRNENQISWLHPVQATHPYETPRLLTSKKSTFAPEHITNAPCTNQAIQRSPYNFVLSTLGIIFALHILFIKRHAPHSFRPTPRAYR